MKLPKRAIAPTPRAPPRPRNGAVAKAAAPGARIMRNSQSMWAATAMRYYDSGAFWLEMEFLAAAIVFHFTLYERVTRRDDAGPALRVVTAVLALFLWFGVGVAGRDRGQDMSGAGDVVGVVGEGLAGGAGDFPAPCLERGGDARGGVAGAEDKEAHDLPCSSFPRKREPILCGWLGEMGPGSGPG